MAATEADCPWRRGVLSVSLCQEQQSTGKHQHEDQYEGLAEALREQHRVIVLLVSQGESAGVETNDQ